MTLPTIRLTNTKTRHKEAFTPLDAENVRMYLCGPTVYDRAHLGNARPVVVFDVLYRLLRHVYGADHVTYVRNFTDVDDKINATALSRKEAGAAGSLEDLIKERTEETIGWYHADMDALGALRPDHEPRATDYIGAMVTMIEGLIEKGHAYEAEGHVLFDVRSYKDYGALSGRSVDDMIAGARVEVAPYKRDPMDFVLWKPSSNDLPGWDSPWGRGRPGWHIECSAMSYELLGESFDIHAGGIDLQFPHHENEVAQSCCAHPEGGFASVWMHNEMLQVEGKKMSKSLGNFFTVRDLLEPKQIPGELEKSPIPGEVIRFVFLSTHYGKPMDWTAEKAEQAEKSLNTLMEAMQLSQSYGCEATGRYEDLVGQVLWALEDDLNTSQAITSLMTQAAVIVKFDDGRMSQDGVDKATVIKEMGDSLLTGLDVLGLLELLQKRAKRADGLSEYANKLTALRAAAMASKDFAPVDAFKAALQEAGVEVRMTKEGVELLPAAGFDPAKLEALK